MEYSNLSCQKTTLEQQVKNKNRARVNLKNKNPHFNSNVSFWQQGKTKFATRYIAMFRCAVGTTHLSERIACKETLARHWP